MTGRTIVDKIWDEHVVADDGEQSLLYLDRIAIHERSGGRMLQGVLDAGRDVARPDLVLAVFDHIIDTFPGRGDLTLFPGGSEFIGVFRDYAARAGIEVIEITDERQGIAHVVAAEQGYALPGTTLVCGDSHTCTLGGLGVLAWGIGITQGEHALATQALRLPRPTVARARLEGTLGPAVTAKDMILALIGGYGAAGGRNAAVEFTGSAIEQLDAEARMTLCNLAVEFGAWTGIVAPDQVTFDYLRGRPMAPSGAVWQTAVEHWSGLRSDPDAEFAFEIELAVDALEPQVTWGTSPEHVIAVSGSVPDPSVFDEAGRASAQKALDYAGLKPGTPIAGVPIDAAFIGSCTNSRLSDLRIAAQLLRGHQVSAGVQAICVPGSTPVKRAAEAEGLHEVFLAAGFEWRESGCSLCFYNGGDSFGTATRVISSTNRNFENRQGPGVRTHLASPLTVAASAIAGVVADPRDIDGS